MEPTFLLYYFTNRNIFFVSRIEAIHMQAYAENTNFATLEG